MWFNRQYSFSAMNAYWLDTSAQYQHKKQVDFDKANEEVREQKFCCAVCDNIITSQSDAIQVYGAHQHTKLNPDGRRFLIRCFSEAIGCALYGEATSYHTWFAGYSWRFVHCEKCNIQLGWYFQENDYFFGLIKEQLIRCDDQ